MKKLKYIKLWENYQEEEPVDIDVIFLVNENDEKFAEDVFAYFPNELYTTDNDDLKTCYVHVGQHSACHINYASESRLATVEEYTPLKEELESIGYVLNIIEAL